MEIRIIDRCRFIDITTSSYGTELTLRQETIKYADRIRDLLQRARFTYKAFDEALHLSTF